MKLSIGNRKFTVLRNNVPGAPRWSKYKLPIRQTLLWVGPVFVLCQPREIRSRHLGG